MLLANNQGTCTVLALQLHKLAVHTKWSPYLYIRMKFKLTNRNENTKGEMNKTTKVSMSPCTTF